MERRNPWSKRLSYVAPLALTALFLQIPRLASASVRASLTSSANVAGTSGTWVAARLAAPGLASFDAITCASVDDCWALQAGSGGITRALWGTTDGGLTWSTETVPDVRGLDALGCAPGTLACWGIGSLAPGSDGDGVIVATTDGGASWNLQTAPAAVSSLSGISCSDALHCLAVGATNSNFTAEVITTSDGGTTWISRPDMNTQAEYLIAVACPSAGDCTAVGEGGETVKVGVILASTDGGVSWTDEYVAAKAVNFQPGSVSCPTVSNCVVVGSAGEGPGGNPDHGMILRSTDGGSSWTPATPPAGTVGLASVSCPSTSECWGARLYQPSPEVLRQGLVESTDGGSTWAAATAAVASNGAGVQVACPSVSVCSSASPVLTTRDAEGSGCRGTAAGGAVVGIAPSPDGGGYWLASATGGLLACGTAPFLGSPLSQGNPLVAPIVAIAAVGHGCGYYELARDGTVYPFGCAAREPGVRGSAPFVGMAVNPAGSGYWLVSADGGVFGVGAPYRGSLPGLGIRTSSVVGIATSPAGGGYWLAGSDGGIYSFGLKFHGSLPRLGIHVHDVVAIDTASVGAGYDLAGADGGVFALGTDVVFCGSAVGRAAGPFVASAAYGFTPGYWLVRRGGSLYGIDAPIDGSPAPGIGGPIPCG